MKHLIALSLDAHRDRHWGPSLRRRALETFSAFDPVNGCVALESEDLIVVCHRDILKTVEHGNRGQFLLHPGSAVTDERNHRRLSARELASVWFRDSDAQLETLAAPFALFGQRGTNRSFSAMCDRYGLAHVYGWQGNGVCAIASSALLIGRLFGLGPDLEAIARFALLGHFPNTETNVKGVDKCAAGKAFSMANGRLVTRQAFVGRESVTPSESPIEAGIGALKESVSAHVETYPECDIELSGGIDSRLMLAAIPKAHRHRHCAVTLGHPDSADVQIAAKIAETSGMHHRVIDTRMLMKTESSKLLDVLYNASLRHDHAANPIEKAVLELCRSQLSDRPRLSGQNGEIARGFYFPGQPLNSPPSTQAVQRLMQWRLIDRDSVFQGLLESELSMKVQGSLTVKLVADLIKFRTWAEALDHLYLSNRMQRWCGNAVSAAYSRRPILMPFFNPNFVNWALASKASDKKNSRLACALIHALAPELSSLPLDSGRTPRNMAGTGLFPATGTLLATGKKVSRRVLRKLTRTGRDDQVSGNIADRLAEVGYQNLIDWNAVHSSNVLSDTAVDAIAAGRIKPDGATLGFLLMLGYTINDLRPVLPLSRSIATPLSTPDRTLQKLTPKVA